MVQQQYRKAIILHKSNGRSTKRSYQGYPVVLKIRLSNLVDHVLDGRMDGWMGFHKTEGGGNRAGGYIFVLPPENEINHCATMVSVTPLATPQLWRKFVGSSPNKNKNTYDTYAHTKHRIIC